MSNRTLPRLTLSLWLTSLGALALGVGCSEENPSGDAGVTDAGKSDAEIADVGSVIDGGTQSDAASPADTGARVDAAAPDAEVHPDAAVPADAGDVDAGLADAGTTTSTVWQRPACTQITGTLGVTFTLDEGATLATIPVRPTGIRYTYGLAALDEPGVLLAVTAERLIRSTDSGCTWTDIAPLSGGFPASLAAAGRDRAYAWSDNNANLWRIDGTTITPLTSPVANIHGLAVDRMNPDHLVIAGGDGELYESTNAGVGRFAALGTAAFPGSGLVYRVAIDPHDLHHAIVGAANGGARWTDDGGATWHDVTGLGTNGANIFSVVVSPASTDVVWFEGIDLAENLANAPGEGRHIWRSVDGGRTATPVLGQTPTVTLINGTLLVPHPTRSDVLYFIFGTYFQMYGTDLFRYDATLDRLTVEHNGYDQIDAITFAPGDPELMFLGITSEQIH